MEYLLKLLKEHFQSSGPWLSFWGGLLKSITTGLILAVCLIFLQCYPGHNSIVCFYWKIAYLTILPLTSIIIWLLSTQIYLRSGAKFKIGLAYVGADIDQKRWGETKKILKDLFRENKIQKRISLRFVPSVFAYENNKSVLFAKRYKFLLLASIQPTILSDKKQVEEIKIRITTKAAYDEFMKLVFPKGLSFQRDKVNNNLLDILDAHAKNLRDMLLILVGTSLYHSEKYEDAAVILRHLDNSIKNTCSPHVSPRLQIRFLDMRCRLARTHFPAQNIPSYDELNEIRQCAETTLCYFNEFPEVAYSLARVRFLIGDVEGAIALTQKYVEKAKSIKNSNGKINDNIWAIAHIDFAFLAFIQGYWKAFYDSFNTILNDGSYKTLDWADLVCFANYVDTLEQYNGIIYLKVIYGLLADQKINFSVVDEARKWATADASRGLLVKILNRCLNMKKSSKNKK